MKIFVFALCIVAYTVALPFENVKENSYPRFIDIPGGDGELHKIDLEAEPDMRLLDEITRNPANNEYWLFTRRNPRDGQALVINNENSITSSNFNPQVPTVVIAHGFWGSQNSEPNPTLREAFLLKSDVNVIILDWRRLALSDYATAVLGVPAVGRGLGDFLAFLNRVTEASFDSMHLIGFDLGAHLVANAGRELNGRVARVTGLDPSGPLWNLNSNRFQPNDGNYTEVIHTDGGSFEGNGIGIAVAHVDFFPNGGTSQPGCLTNLCNHNRAWQLYAATVSYNHLEGRRCENTLQIALNSCIGERLLMGNDDLNKHGYIGMYRVNTLRTYPF